MPIFKEDAYRHDLDGNFTHFIKVMSNAKNIGYTQGNTVGYSRVSRYDKEINENPEIITTVFEFMPPEYLTNLSVGVPRAFCGGHLPNVHFKEKSWISGKKTKTISFDNNNNKLKTNNFFYQDFNYSQGEDDDITYIPVFKVDIFGQHAEHIIENYECHFFKSDLSIISIPARNYQRLDKQTTKEYFNSESDSIKTKTVYNYEDAHPVKPSKITTEVIGDSKKSFRYYEYLDPDEFNHTPDTLTIYPDFITKKRSGIIRENDFYVSDGLIIDYNDHYQPLKTYRELAESINFIDGEVSNIKFKEYEYDSEGSKKPIQETIDYDNDEFNITYIWGYNYTYPIAKIENATYDDALSALTHSIDDLQTKGSDDLIDIFNDLRDDLTNAMITSYTYSPLIGMTSQTDPRGETIYFNYDGFGRLEEIRVDDEKIMEQYEYHYAEINGNGNGNGSVKDTLQVTVEAFPEDGAANLSGGGEYPEGETANISVDLVEGAGYSIKHWEKNNEVLDDITGTSFNYEITEDSDFLVVFGMRVLAEPYPTMEELSIELDPDTTRFSYGDTLQLTANAEPDDGYKFKEWQKHENDSLLSNDNPYSFEVTEPIDINGVFEEIKHILTIDVNAPDGYVLNNHYTVVPDPKQQHERPHNQSVTVTAQKKTDDLDFKGWYDEDDEIVSEEGEYVFEITEDITLEAVFELAEGLYD